MPQQQRSPPLTATFASAEGRQWPGQFANVTLVLANESDAIVMVAWRARRAARA